MLLGENFSGRHKGDLIARLDRLQRRQCRDNGFAAADVALQQALHRFGTREVAPNLGHHPGLRAR